jgi:hypothetical protein
MTTVQRTQSAKVDITDSKHSYSEAEKAGIVDFINQEVPDAKIDPRTTEIFERVKDGILIYKLIEAVQPGTITAKMNDGVDFGDQKIFKHLQNQQFVLEGARKLGCQITNIGGQDLVSGTPHLVLGVLWQVVRFGLLKKVSELSGDTLGLPPEQLLLKWMNYHLIRAGYTQVITNFGTDLQNSEALTRLLHQLEPSVCDLNALQEKDMAKRAEMVLQNADKIGCRKFVQASDIYKANARLMVAFIATIFLKYPDMGEKDLIAQLRARIAQLEKENRELREKLAAAEEENKRAKDLVVKLENDTRTAQTKVVTLEKEFNQQIEKLNREHQLEMSHLKEQYEAQIHEVEERSKRSVTENEQLLREQYEKEIAELKKKMKEREELTIKTVNEAKDSMKQVVDKMKQQQEIFMNTAREREEKAQQEIERLKQQIEQMKKEFEEQQTKEIEIHKETIKTIHTQTEINTQTMVKQYEEREQALNAELERLRKQLKEHLDRAEKMRKGMLTIDRQGWLIKKGNTGGKMQKRWFVLRGEYLLYFKGKEAQSLAHPAGSIYLVTATVTELDEKESVAKAGSKDMKYGFEIKLPQDSDNGRVYFLIAENDTVRKQWMESIKLAKGSYFIRVKEQKTDQ